MSNNKIHIDWSSIRRIIERDFAKKHKNAKVYGIPRGGTYIAAMIDSARIGIAVLTPEEADVIVDDLVDSGETFRLWKARFPGKKFWACYEKSVDFTMKDWMVFPWDEDPDAEVGQNVTRLLQYIGQDVKREGLLETPKRYVKFLKEFTSPPEYKMTVFKNEGTDEMVIQKNIPFYSLCEHHLAPFFGTAAVAYIPDKNIVGLSKLARTVDHFSRRPQNQERITQQIANLLDEKLSPLGVAVVLKARHMCVEMRGIEKTGSETVTSAMVGCFKKDAQCRNEFLQLIK